MISPANGTVDKSKILKNIEGIKTMAEEVASVISEKDHHMDNNVVKDITTKNGAITDSTTSANDELVDDDMDLDGLTSLEVDLKLKLSDSDDELMELENCSPIRSSPTTPKSSEDLSDLPVVNGNNSLENEIMDDFDKTFNDSLCMESAHSKDVPPDSSDNLKNVNIDSNKSISCTEINCKASGICSCSIMNKCDNAKIGIDEESHDPNSIQNSNTDTVDERDSNIVDSAILEKSRHDNDIGNVSIVEENNENNKESSDILTDVNDGLDVIKTEILLKENDLDLTHESSNKVSDVIKKDTESESAINKDDIHNSVDKEILLEKITNQSDEQSKVIELGEKECIVDTEGKGVSFVLTDEELIVDSSSTSAIEANNDLLVALDNDIIMADNLDVLNQDLSQNVSDTMFEGSLEVPDSSKSKEMENIESNRDGSNSNIDDAIMMDIEEGTPSSKSSSSEEENKNKSALDASGYSASTKRPSTTPLNLESAKKLKLSSDTSSSDIPEKLVSLDFLRSFKSQISKMTRKDLEQFTLAKIVEAINHKTHIGELRTQVEAQEHLTEQLRSKVEQSRKQLKDLDFVHTSLEGQIIRVQKSGRFIPPPLITRSVGLQVSGHCASKHVPEQPRKKVVTPESSNEPILEETTSPVHEIPTPPPPSKRIAGPASRTMGKSVTSATPGSSKTTAAKAAGPPITKSPVVAKKSVTTVPTQQSSQSPQGSNKQAIVNKPTFSTKTVASTPILNKALASPAQPNNISRQTSHSELTAATKSVIDLTDEDERGSSLSEQAVRGRPPQHMPTATSSQQLAYLVPSNGQGGQQLIIATNSSSSSNQATFLSRPPMFKPITGINPVGGPIRHTMVTNSVRNPGPRTVATSSRRFVHPAPLPLPVAQKSNNAWRKVPPKPSLKITKVAQGIVISWTMEHLTDEYEEIVSYQIYAYQETTAPPNSELWRKVGDVKAMPLPMACTLTQFLAGNRYHFAVRAVDVKSRVGHFSVPGNIMLVE